MTTAARAIGLAGVHHVRIPVTDVLRSFAFWHDLLGYEKDFVFPPADASPGLAITHPDGGPWLTLWSDADRVPGWRGLIAVSLMVPDRATLEEIAARCDRSGIPHSGIQPAIVDSSLIVEDPDGIEIGFFVAGPRDGLESQ